MNGEANGIFSHYWNSGCTGNSGSAVVISLSLLTLVICSIYTVAIVIEFMLLLLLFLL